MQHPIVGSQASAEAYCRWKSRMAERIRLPYDLEWERRRVGDGRKYSWGS